MKMGEEEGLSDREKLERFKKRYHDLQMEADLMISRTESDIIEIATKAQTKVQQKLK